MTDLFKGLVLAVSVSLLAGCGIDRPGLDDESTEDTTETGGTGTGGGSGTGSGNDTGGDSGGDEGSTGEDELTVGATDRDIGPADADSFSLSVSEAIVKKAYSMDGITTTFSVRVGDRNNHVVEDGTRIAFWTEYGFIEDSCTTTNGTCSVTWTSGGWRPNDGLSTVVAYTLGEDSFIDSDERNAIYNVASDLPNWSMDEAILSLPELFYDRNYDGYDNASFVDAGTGLTLESDAFEDLNNDDTHNNSASKYRGTQCSAAAISEGHCEQTQVHVWAHTQIALTPEYSFPTINVMGGPWTIGATEEVSVLDSLGYTPLPGTKIEVTSESEDFSVEYPAGTEVPSTGEANSDPFVFEVIVYDSAPGTATVTITYDDVAYSRQISYN